MSKLTQAIARGWAKLPFTPDAKPAVAIVRLAGVIASDARPGRGISADAVDKPLRKAFASRPKLVVLAVNSPGGAPAQSRMIHDRARFLSAKHDVPIMAYIEDVGASGGYMIALAGEEVFADPFAIVGSIGAISAGFGFQDAIGKLGVERRVHTSGRSKSQLDPFREEEPEDVARLEDLLEKIHRLFVAMVQHRRAGRLTTSEDLFDGRYWLAGDAAALGLIDGVGDLPTILRDRYGEDVRIRRYEGGSKGLVGRLLSGRLSVLDTEETLAALEARSLWSRLGL